MWSFEYTSEQGVFCMENQEDGFYFSVEMEDGMSSEVIGDNPIAFFHSKRADETKQVKTVLCVNIQNYTLNISTRTSDGEYSKHEITLSSLAAKSLFNMANIYQHEKKVPSFSFKPVPTE
jgi:hypothetical protein